MGLLGSAGKCLLGLSRVAKSQTAVKGELGHQAWVSPSVTLRETYHRSELSETLGGGAAILVT